MRRRKVLAGLGSLAAGGAAAMGTGAFTVVRADRSLNVGVVGDQSAYLGFDPTISPYASQPNNQIVFEYGSNGQGGAGLNANADSRFDNVFRIINQGTNTIDVIPSDDINSINWASDSPLTMYHSDDEKTGTDWTGLTAFDNDPNPDDYMPNPEGQNGAGYGADSSLLQLEPGSDAYVHMQFYLRDSNLTDGSISGVDAINTSASAIPDTIGFYARETLGQSGDLYTS
jgi:hypothetical protein